MSTTTETTISTSTPTQTISTHDSSYIPRGPVTAKLQFFQPPSDNTKPFNYVEQPPTGKPQRNFGDHDLPITIQDLRSHEADFTLDTHAFVALTSIPPSAEPAFTDDASVKQNYYPEVEQLLLKHVPGASRIFLFDHTIRRALPAAPRAPVTSVHIDQTAASAAARVRHHLPAEADTLLKTRVRIINVWRPLNGPVQSFPLAFADSTSVPDDALIGIEHRYPDRTGETAAVKATEGQRWWYWSGMEGGERLLLQCFDSEKGARVPHTAFVDPRSPEGVRPRESIEVRALVFG